MKKRFMASVLVVAMVLTMLTGLTFATDGNVAKIGTTEYATLAEAIAAVQNGETITLLTDCAENVTIKQVASKSFTINGNDKTYTGTIYVDGNTRSTGAETLTIKNVNFVISGTYGIAAHTKKNTFPHNLTVENCTFTGEGDAYKNCYGIYLRHAYNITVKDVVATGLFDLVYGNTAVTGFTAENVTVTDSGMGFMLPYAKGDIVFKNVKLETSGAGVGMYNYNTFEATFEDCDITGNPAIWVEEKTANNCKVTIDGSNELSTTGSELVKIVRQSEDTDGDDIIVDVTDNDDVMVDPETGNIIVKPHTYRIKYQGGAGSAYVGNEGSHRDDWVHIYYTSDAPVVMNSGEFFKKTGYEVTGWKIGNEVYAVGESVEKVFTSTPNGMVTATAVWSPITYRIKYQGGADSAYVGNEGSHRDDWVHINYTYDAPVVMNSGEFFKKTGYKVTGWKIGNEVYAVGETVEKNFTSVKNGMVTANAVWSPITYTIKYNANGGSYTGSLPNSNPEWLQIKGGYTYDVPVTLYDGTDFERKGYTLTGWEIGGEVYDLGDTVEKNFSSVQYGTVQANAVWTVNQYTITFDTDGGTEIAAITQDYGTDVTAPADPTKTGYTFTGWDTQIPSTMPAEDLTITAQWDANTYGVIYDPNGGEGEVKTQEVVFGSTFKFNENEGFTNFTRKGYTFAGWNSKADGTGKAYSTEEEYVKDAAASIRVYAQWTVNTYGVTYKANGGEGADYTSKAVFGEKFTMAENEFTREGYTFSGWNTKKDGTGVSYTAGKSYTKTSAKNLVVYAQWTVNPYTLTVDNANDTEVITKTVNYGETVTLETPVWEGHTFKGWLYTNTETGESVEVMDTMPAYDLTVKAVWDTNVYTVTYLDGFGKTFTTFNVTYGAKVPVAASPIVPGYDFMGWTPSVPKTMPASNLTFTAQWQLSACKVTVNMTGNGFVSSNYNLNAVPYGASVTLTLTPATNYVYIYVNGEKLTGNTYTFTVTDDVTIDVTFEMESFIYGDHNTSSTKSWYEKMLEIYANSLK